MRNISLFTLIEIALKHIFILVVAALVAATGAFCYCEFVSVPRYSATGSIMVTNGAIINVNDMDDVEGYNKDGNLSNTDIQASLNFADTVIDILNTNGIFKELSENLNGRYSYSQLKGSSRISRRSNNTLFIDISFSATSREEAVSLVNEYLSIAPNYINTFVSQTAVTATSIADNASKTYPRTLITTGTAGIIGAVAAYAIVFLIYCANTVIKGEDDFKDRFELPVLGCIPDFSTAKNEKYYKKYNYEKGVRRYYGK